MPFKNADFQCDEVVRTEVGGRNTHNFDYTVRPLTKIPWNVDLLKEGNRATSGLTDSFLKSQRSLMIMNLKVVIYIQPFKIKALDHYGPTLSHDIVS